MNALRNAALLAAAAVAMASAQTQPVTPPAPPACLSGPMTNGNVTLSCSMIDGTGTTDVPLSSGNYFFGIRATSADTAVNAIQVDLSVQLSTDPNATTPTGKRSITVLKNSAGAFTYVFLLSPTYDAKGNPSLTAVLSITIQELKPSSSQSF